MTTMRRPPSYHSPKGLGVCQEEVLEPDPVVVAVGLALVLHAQALGYGYGFGVVAVDDRMEFWELEYVEGVSDAGPGRFGGVALAPRGAAELPADLGVPR